MMVRVGLLESILASKAAVEKKVIEGNGAEGICPEGEQLQTPTVKHTNNI